MANDVAWFKSVGFKVLTTPEAGRKSARARIAPRAGLATPCGLWVYHHTLGNLGPGGSRLAAAREEKEKKVTREEKTFGGGPYGEVAPKGGATIG